jgi:hypothetical protein
MKAFVFVTTGPDPRRRLNRGNNLRVELARERAGWRHDPERDLRAGPCQPHRGAVRHIADEIALPEATIQGKQNPAGGAGFCCVATLSDGGIGG